MACVPLMSARMGACATEQDSVTARLSSQDPTAQKVSLGRALSEGVERWPLRIVW